ncbi:MAG: phospho-N-acetylmuramoyl-pentapeptide-transferase [Acidobacteriota bacterium]|nr:phospho-N-acetylmuramoyl-pentapeptide-transferase [Blastocatellia bacterium]MDW8412265.1 phospho-N-acetylmuramoyl-pentapeptide-transferase [Acidobacteriota bacterium]
MHDSLSWLRVFEYVIFRTSVAALSALMMSLLVGPYMIRKLREFQVGQQIREEGPRSHQSKKGTPTMGGLLIIGSVAVSTLLWADLKNANVWIVLFSMLAFGAIGFADDYLKVVRKHNLGLTGKQKIALQFATCAAVIAALYFTGYQTVLTVPFIKTFKPEIWWPIYAVFIWFVITGSSNAVNLTDGLDGLAISITFVTAAALTGFTYVTGHELHAVYLGLVPMPQVEEVTIFCAALAGASLGFLWFNAPPAEVFMGDVGSLSIGGAIGTVAVVIKQEFLLALIGGVFVIEALSVMLQVGFYKLTKGRRIFKMSPLHHHFELSGWKETKIVFRFLILAIFFALLSLATLKLR